MLTMFCGRVSAECSEVMDGNRETVVGNECVEEEDKSRSKTSQRLMVLIRRKIKRNAR